MLKKLSYEKKTFLIFLLVNVIVWTGVGLIRNVLPTDALECIYWGGLHDFGTPKHPPLSGWLAYYVYSVFKSDFSIYLISQLFILTGVWYIYKLAKIFLDENRAILATIVMEGCWVYSYITGYYGFNPDVILLCVLPVLTYVFYNCMKDNKTSDWIKLGIIVGLAFLNKYQTILILASMFTWALMFKREVFKQKTFYLSVVIAFLIFLPHLIWLFKYDFFSLMYFESEMFDTGLIGHVVAVLLFLITQIAAIVGVVLLFSLLLCKQKTPFKIELNWNKESAFLIIFGLLPLVIHLLMGLFGGGTMRPRWGFEFLFLTGIMLFYFIPTKEISKEDFKFVLKSAYCVLVIIFISVGTLFAVEKNYRSRYPVADIYKDLKADWEQKTGTPLKYLGGYIEWTLPLTIYTKDHPQIILDTNKYDNIWIDENDLKKSGIMVIGRRPDRVKFYVHKSCPYLEEDYQIEPVEYKFTIKNALNMQREYTVFYHIVKPEKN